MVCYQVKMQFAFSHGKPALVSTLIKKQENAPAFLVHTGLPFGQVLNHSRFFSTEKEAAGFVSHVRAVYKNRIVSNPALPGGQLTLF